jgi:hypothetical protein
MAVAVEAASRANQKIVVVEFAETGEEEGGGCSVWDEELPLLCDTSNVAGGIFDSSWSGRTVSVARVVRRWFTFETVKWPHAREI